MLNDAVAASAVDGLHGGNTLVRGKAREGFHHEGGKRKEDSRHQAAAECRNKRQVEEKWVNRCHKTSRMVPPNEGVEKVPNRDFSQPIEIMVGIISSLTR
ncbi:MAG: hypothetical protein ACREV4_14630 [Gammaproteobacteria bacterium]